MKTRIKSPLFKNLQNIFDFEHVKFTGFVITCRKEPPCIKTNFKRIFQQSRFKQIVRKFIFVQNTID